MTHATKEDLWALIQASSVAIAKSETDFLATDEGSKLYTAWVSAPWASEAAKPALIQKSEVRKTAEAALQAMADRIQTAQPDLTAAAAYAKALGTPEGSTLYSLSANRKPSAS